MLAAKQVRCDIKSRRRGATDAMTSMVDVANAHHVRAVRRALDAQRWSHNITGPRNVVAAL